MSKDCGASASGKTLDWRWAEKACSGEPTEKVHERQGTTAQMRDRRNKKYREFNVEAWRTDRHLWFMASTENMETIRCRRVGCNYHDHPVGQLNFKLMRRTTNFAKCKGEALEQEVQGTEYEDAEY